MATRYMFQKYIVTVIQIAYTLFRLLYNGV